MGNSLQLFELPECSNGARPTYSTTFKSTTCGAYDITLAYYCAGSGAASVQRYSTDKNKLTYETVNLTGRRCKRCSDCEGYPDDPLYVTTCGFQPG